jgi:hypothetical protein
MAIRPLRASRSHIRPADDGVTPSRGYLRHSLRAAGRQQVQRAVLRVGDSLGRRALRLHSDLDDGQARG